MKTSIFFHFLFFNAFAVGESLQSTKAPLPVHTPSIHASTIGTLIFPRNAEAPRNAAKAPPLEVGDSRL